ncbi:hypothetical protein OIE43_00700 [Streptomyces pseudovenezuelae]|uniref:PE domain-containing protein n=1 Tax=Streptomyces pseudovenezuelae TaxID=67350 RepID=A0A117PPD7_9ACTN|nr:MULTISPECIES: hypothetical protein [Streptomyces]KUM84380.1 hypothetical protein AQI94_31335 [Streptomyces pseudovenezuelae]WUA93788.1 hypothetical protein OHO81_43500 [Streptomyces pseudovenezuelae]
MSSDRYEANPAGLRQGVELIGILPDLAKKAGDDFIAQQAEYQGAYGYDDEFYQQNFPGYTEANETLLSVFREYGTAFSYLGSAVLGNLRNIEGTQQDALEGINLQNNKLDAFGDGSGSGKH